jgi:uncharacterized membrane-anchored protein YhcB (DUF1043 family)
MDWTYIIGFAISVITLLGLIAGLASTYVFNPIFKLIKELFAKVDDSSKRSSTENTEIKEAFSAHRGESKEFRANMISRVDSINEKVSNHSERLAVDEANIKTLQDIVLPKNFKP